ncbi:MAG: TIGR03032 family protein, partial [Proteobacteria bacterium]|nr:TIGR03032 family protein [Pseudomonadota bacterium]
MNHPPSLKSRVQPMTQTTNEEKEEKKPGDAIKDFDFSSQYTDNLPALLKGLNISLAVTSYQSQALFFIRSDGKTINTDFKRFRRPMGLAVTKDQITLGIFKEILKFNRNDSVIRDFEDRKKIDACYTPSASHTTGMINIHDIAYGDQGLWVTNSAFSCLATIEPDYSFVPRWKPPFITKLRPEDRCHLNGMALKDGKPRYVTTFDQGDRPRMWKKEKKVGGTLIDVETDEILLNDLIMPHSPRYYQGYVYFCDSGRGLVNRYDPETRELTTLIKLQGFTRGMDFWGPLLFVGLSKTRKSEISDPPPISTEFDETFSGVWIINLDDNSLVGEVRFEG